jgi:hypothetical protein
VSRAASSRSEPQASENADADHKKADQKADKNYDKVISKLADEGSNALVVGNNKGEVTAKYDTNDLRKKGYKSLSDFAEKAGSKECKKISSKCRKCPNGKIYCTNDARFASGEEGDEKP